MATGGRIGGKAPTLKEKTATLEPTKKKRTLKVKPIRRSKSKVVKREASKLMDFTLKTYHIVNGVMYGPGRVRANRDLALTLLDMDRRAEESERTLHQEKATMILDNKRSISVAPGTFNQYLLNPQSLVFTTISGRGM